MHNYPITTRRYDLDWLRVIGIALVLYYHTGMIFVSWGWHIKSTIPVPGLEYPMAFLHQWRMPLLLFISGAGTYLAFRRRNLLGYVVERHRRLFIPLLAGTLLIVPPQIYMEHLQQFPSFGAFYKDLVQRFTHADLDWRHLWFVAYLFVYSIGLLPLLLLLRLPLKGFTQLWYNMVKLPAGALIPASLLAAIQVLLFNAYPREAMNLLHDGRYLLYLGTYFLLGFVFMRDERLWDVLKRQRRLLGIVALSLIGCYYLGYSQLRSLPDDAWTPQAVGPLFYCWLAFKALTGWAAVAATAAWGYTYLNHNKPVLKYLNQALYPFYILHQTLIVMIGYYLVRWPVGNFAQFWLISTAAGLASVAIYLVARQFMLTRFIMGIKKLPLKPAPKPGLRERVPVQAEELIS